MVRMDTLVSVIPVNLRLPSTYIYRILITLRSNSKHLTLAIQG